MKAMRFAATLITGALLGVAVLVILPEYGPALRELTADLWPYTPPALTDDRVYADAVAIGDLGEGGFEHFIGPYFSIHPTNWTAYHLGRLDDLKLTVIVDRDGQVVQARPVSGPKEFFAEAAHKALQARFIPFQRGGQPVGAKIEDFPVAVRPPESRPDYRTPFPQVKDWDSLSIKLAYTSGWGSSSYAIDVTGRGAVTFEGSHGLAIAGVHRATIPEAKVRELVGALQRAEWFWSFDEYVGDVTDQDTTYVQVSFDGRTKSLSDYAGEYTGLPDAFFDVKSAIHRIVGADRWLKGNHETGPSLAAENWDFKADTYPNVTMLGGIAQYGTDRALRDVIALGAPIITGDRTVAKDGMRLHVDAPIVPAAERDDLTILHTLLGLDVTWSQPALGAALSTAASRGDIEATTNLLHEGADPRWRHRNGETALMDAAGAGIPDVVALVLTNMPKLTAHYVNAIDNVGMTALHHAVYVFSNGTAAKKFWPKIDRARVAKLLLDNGARVDMRDQYGQTPLIANGSDIGVAAVLVAAGADVNAQDNNGRTALMNSYKPQLTRLLLEAGADPGLRDKEGKTALDLASDTSSGGARDTKPVLEWWLAKRKRP